MTGDVIQYELDRVRQILTWGCKQRLIRFNPLQHVDRVKTIDKPDILPFHTR